MGKLLALAFVFSIIFIVLPVSNCIDKSPKAVEKWIKKLSHKQEKVTKLQFYLQDVISGKNPTSFQVAKSDITFQTPLLFGLVHVIDDLITEGPDPKSAEIGRAQGLFAASSIKDEFSLLMCMNIIFTTGKYRNSTLSIEGRNPILSKYREMSVVGGSGIFRLARGIVTVKTNFFNSTSPGDAIVKYNIVVLHY